MIGVTSNLQTTIMMVLHFNVVVAFAYIFIFIFILMFSAHSLSGPHIADVNILLPPKLTHPVEYRLLGTDGCFKWSWDHHDILSVVPEYNQSNHCSTSARLRSIAPYTGRKETSVYAADVLTGTVVRCKVYIDIFSKIHIFHSSVKLDLDGLATLRVRAFDAQDNVFSSLVGLHFLWQLKPQNQESSHHLVHVPLFDSPLSDCSGFCGDLNIQIKLEDSGAFSDLFVVKGISIGHEIVSVHFIDPHLDNLTDEIVLTVAEAMSLDPPSPVLVLVGAMLQYTLKVISGNIHQVVPLPSPFHRWSALNSSIAQVDAMMGLVHALKLGETSIIVEDTRVAGHFQMSSLNVVLPDYISLYLLPLSESGVPIEGVKSMVPNARWYVVAGWHYLIKLKVYSQGPDARVIYITKNEDVKLYYGQPKIWKIYPVLDSDSVKYGEEHSRILEATSEGVGKLSASLTYSTSKIERKEVLKVVQEVMVCERVWIKDINRNASLSSILLPWAPDIFQEAELKAIGGCASTPADYRWFSSDNSVLSVSATGVVQVKRPGKATVKVVSSFDNLNFDEVSIEVVLPASMVILPNFPVETVVGSHLQAAVSMKASTGDFFYRCDAFSSFIKWSTGSDIFLTINSTIEDSLESDLKEIEQSISGPACSQTYLYAASPGRAILHATFFDHAKNGFSRQILLKASTTIASFAPLIVHQAGDGDGNKFGGYWVGLDDDRTQDGLAFLNDLYLAPGSRLEVAVIGGPERWSNEVDYLQTVDVLDEFCSLPKTGALIYEVQKSEGSKYIILCQALGNFTLVFKRGNLVGNDHLQPVVTEAKLQLKCSFPSSIVVLADEPVNKLDIVQNAILADRNPSHVRSMPIIVANGRTIRVSAVGISMSGVAFANSSSIPLTWELNDCEDVAAWDEAYNVKMCVSTWERFLRLENASGQCILQAMAQSHVSYGSSDNVLRDAIRLQVVSMLQVLPEFRLLFLNPDAETDLSVVGGSCILDVAVNDSRVIEVKQLAADQPCSRLTMVPRSVGTAVIEVFDVGLSPLLKSTSMVKVAEVDWLKIIISGKAISLMEGSIISVDLLAGTDDGDTFEHTQYAFMNIRVHIEDQIVDHVDGDNFSTASDGYISASSFRIYGRMAGVTTLFVSSKQQSGKEICSEAITIEVFAPPVIHPSDIFLVPGAFYVLTVKGGPRIDVLIEYTSMNESTVDVHAHNGKLSAITPGNATIVATFYGNARAVLCQAHGEVRVGIPSAAILNVQSEQLAVGREMPIFPFLVEGDLFSFYDLCKDYEWIIEDEKVLTFNPPEHMNPNNYEPPSPGSSSYEYEQVNFIKVLYGRCGGTSKVSVAFTCDFSLPGSAVHSLSYKTSVLIKVFPDPPLAQGIPLTWVLPPHYTTSDLLPSSPKSHSSREIQRQTGSVAYTLLGCSGLGSDELQNSVVSISGNSITTKDSNNLACIQAKDLNTGRIEVAVCVRVAEVTQIRFLRKSTIHLAVGAEFELPVHFYDKLGNPFLEAHEVVPVDIMTNFKNILSIDNHSLKNGSILVKGMQHGRALVGVRFDDNPRKSDYVMISVGAHIIPQDPIVQTGTSINFSIEGLNDQASGQWLSGEESVVSIDPLSGKAVAVGKGTTSVTFHNPSLKLQTTFRVMDGDLTFLSTPSGTLTNSPYPLGGYRFLVKLRNHVYGAPSRSIDIPYECQVEPSFVGYSKPWKDLDTGDSFCLFFPYSPEHLANAVPQLQDKRRSISIFIHAKLSAANDVSGSISALFVGGFSILDVDKDSLQLNLSRNSKSSILTLVGNTDVVFQWLNQDLLNVMMLHKEGSGIGGRALFEVKVLKEKPFEDTLRFSLPANGQSIEIYVKYEVDEGKTSSFDATLWAGVAVCLTVLIVSIIIFICFLGKPDVARSNIVSCTQNIAPPQTPERSNIVETEMSPRTPQPFIDYVRRTIDETPYYRRDRRRRFDPQNTF